MYQPCRRMADVQTMREKFGQLQDDKSVMSWAPFAFPRLSAPALIMSATGQ